MRKSIIFILEIILVILIIYCSSNSILALSGLKKYILIGIFIILLIALYILNPKKIIKQEINTDLEEVTLKKWNKKNIINNINHSYENFYNNYGPHGSSIKKYKKKMSSGNFSNSNNMLILIECNELTKEIVEYIENEINSFKNNFIQKKVLDPKLDILIITLKADIETLYLIDSQILSFIRGRYMLAPNGVVIPLVINEDKKRIYLSKFENNDYQSILNYYNKKRKIKKYLRKKEII